jgi:hypothetical protein
VQGAKIRQHLGRLNRAKWDREFLRDRVTGIVRPRVYALKRFDRRRMA